MEMRLEMHHGLSDASYTKFQTNFQTYLKFHICIEQIDANTYGVKFGPLPPRISGLLSLPFSIFLLSTEAVVGNKIVTMHINT